jgi:hypothetical protein
LSCVGAWRSLVARYTGGVEVVGSSPAAPTIVFLVSIQRIYRLW